MIVEQNGRVANLTGLINLFLGQIGIDLIAKSACIPMAC
jgi:hypothetical protein